MDKKLNIKKKDLQKMQKDNLLIRNENISDILEMNLSNFYRYFNPTDNNSNTHKCIKGHVCSKKVFEFEDWPYQSFFCHWCQEMFPEDKVV